MKTRHRHLIFAWFAFSAVSQAQDRPAAGEHRPPPPPPPGFGLFDADRDGQLSAEEIQNASAVLGKLDRNGDGLVSPEEMRPPRNDEGKPPGGGRPMGPPPPPPLIAALDADQNGRISAGEMEDAREALKDLDENGDGELTPEELHPHGPPPPGFDGGPGGGHRPQAPPPDE